MGVLKKATPHTGEMKVVPDEKDGTQPFVDAAAAMTTSDDTLIGQLALDVFQTENEIVVIAPIAGVSKNDISITITNGVLTIAGRRALSFKAAPSDYVTQECFWGDFSRNIILPDEADLKGIVASFKNGILTVRVPKTEVITTKMVRIKEE